jgi:hypothetical protein
VAVYAIKVKCRQFLLCGFCLIRGCNSTGGSVSFNFSRVLCRCAFLSGVQDMTDPGASSFVVCSYHTFSRRTNFPSLCVKIFTASYTGGRSFMCRLQPFGNMDCTVSSPSYLLSSNRNRTVTRYQKRVADRSNGGAGNPENGFLVCPRC